MSFLRRLFRSRKGQSTTEYMVLLSTVAIAAMAVFAYFTDKNNLPQKSGKCVADNFASGLTNDDASGTCKHKQDVQ